MNPQLAPKSVRRIPGNGIEISWPDNTTCQLPPELLRRNCPCASCREQRGDQSHAAPLTAKKTSLKVIQHSQSEALDLQEIWGIGNYAIGIRWGDGHDDGIFTWAHLHELCGMTAEKVRPPH